MWKYIYIRNICLKFLEVEAQRETSLPNPATVGCLFVLHLLVNSVIVMASQKGSRVQFCCYLRKQGWLFNLGALEWIHSWVRLNGLFDFCNRQKIIMVLGDGWSLTGLFELVWYLAPNVAMASRALFVCLFCCYLLVKKN